MIRALELPPLTQLRDSSSKRMQEIFGSGSLREALSWVDRQWTRLESSSEKDGVSTFRIQAGLPPGIREVHVALEPNRIAATCGCSRFERGSPCTHICSAILLLIACETETVASGTRIEGSSAGEAPVIKGLILAPQNQYGRPLSPLFGERWPMTERVPGFYIDSLITPVRQTPYGMRVPALLTRTTYSEYGWRVSAAERAKRTLQYWMNDGNILDLSMLFSSERFMNQLPRALLPTIEPAGREHCSLSEFDYSPNEEKLKELERSVVAVVERALALEIPVYLTDEPQSDCLRKAMRIRKIGILSSSDVIWSLSPDPDITRRMEGRAILKLDKFGEGRGPGLMYDRIVLFREGALLFHELGPEVNRIDYLVRDPRSTSTFFDGVAVQGHQRVVDTSNVLHALASSNRIRFNFGFFTESIPFSLQQPEIHIAADGSWNLASNVPVAGKNYRLWNIHPSAGWAIRLITNGLGGLFQDDAKAYATKARSKRQTDLKLVRHHGIGAFVFLELMELIKTGPGRRDRTVKEWLSDVLKKVAALLMDADSGEFELSSICSLRMVKEVRSILETTANADPPTLTVFVDDHAVTLERNALFALLALERIVREELNARGISLFKSQRIAAFQTFSTWPLREHHFTREGELTPDSQSIRYPSPDRELSSPANPPAVFLPLLRSGFKVFQEGHEFERLAPGDLTGAIRIAEEESSNALDWFELDPDLFFRGEKLSGAQAKRLSSHNVLEFKGKYYLLAPEDIPEINHLLRFWEDLSRPSKRRAKSEVDGEPRIRHHALEILALRARGVPVTGKERWKTICDFYDSLGGDRKCDAVPKSLRHVLKPYQEVGVQWIFDLYRLRMGGILADEMGLGKTLQALAFVERLREDRENCKGIVIVPTSLTYNWASEIQRFTPDIPTCIFDSRQKDSHAEWIREHPLSLTICTYGLLVENCDYLKAIEWDVLIMDEAQSVKNAAALRTQTVQRIPARFKLALTGTPMENHYGEFHTLIDTVVPGCLGDSMTFRSRFVTPENVRREDIQYLKLKTKPLWLRRAKSEILKDLPDKVESVAKLPFENRQRVLYRDTALSWNTKVGDSLRVNGEAKSQLVMLTALLRLRQICSDPRSISGIEYDLTPPKIETLTEALLDIVGEGMSALVFTQFLGTFARLEMTLGRAEIPVFSMNGSHSRRDREKILAGFSSYPEGAAMLMTLKTGGVGLNLTKASYVFHVDPWWNPAVENQATDRSHRIGQDKEVRVYRYIMEGSVEEKIEHLKKRKSARFDSLFLQSESGETEVGDSLLTRADFTYLIS